MSTILVIEDDEMLNAGICFNIQNNNWKALNSYCIKDAKEIIKQNKVDLILLDVNLPDGNGFEFAKIIKEEYKIPFIFLTAHNLDEEILSGFDLRCR
jgi:DNA-binding response OmpR family regulator